jgi:hypothetical protein
MHVYDVFNYYHTITHTATTWIFNKNTCFNRSTSGRYSCGCMIVYIWSMWHVYTMSIIWGHTLAWLQHNINYTYTYIHTHVKKIFEVIFLLFERISKSIDTTGGSESLWLSRKTKKICYLDNHTRYTHTVNDKVDQLYTIRCFMYTILYHM